MMERNFTVSCIRPDADAIVARDEMLHSLMDGRARWPDGTLRQHAAPLYERLKQKEMLRD